jgi:glycosyltransferase involved in cell wall biosynthesis
MDGKGTTRIFWCHPCLMDYRKPLFDLVQSKYKVKFFFMHRSEIDHKYDAVYAKPRFAGRMLSLSDLIGLYRGIKESDVFISSFLSVDCSVVGSLIAKLLNKKVIIWEEISLSRGGVRTAVRRWGSRTIAKWVDAFFVLGEPHRRALCELGVPHEEVFLANEYPGHLYSEIEPERMESLAVDGKDVIFYLGRFAPVKGVEYLLEAYSLLEKKYSNTLLLIVGYGPLENELKKKAEDLHIESVRFVKRITDVKQKKYLFDISRMMVVPSIIRRGGSIEAGPMVVLEALSAGTPVLGTDGMMSHARFISNGVNGFIVRHSDSLALLEKMEEILNWENPQEIRNRILLGFSTIKGFGHQFEVMVNAINYCLEK